MISLLISVLLAWMPFAQEGKDIPFDIRARQNLLMGKGGTSGSLYYDVVITRQPTQGILIKLPYTKKGGKFSFDLHHRIAITGDFGLPAEVTTVIEVLSGGTTSIGVYTIADKINEGDKFSFMPRAISKTFSGLTSTAASSRTSGSDDVLDASTGVLFAIASSGGSP